MRGIRRSGMRPKLAAHLRTPSKKAHLNRSKEEREREHAATDAWAERERAKEPERMAAAEAAAQEARRIARLARQREEEGWS